MNHWPFIIASYALTFLGVGGLTLWAYVVMRRAEREAEAVTRR
ncbi:MAG TPA: heme exporter protein CcmD [Allosphingosinicella sp.]